MPDEKPDDRIEQLLDLSTQTFDLLRKIDARVVALDKKVDALGKTLDAFRADTQDEFSIIKSRLHRLEHPPQPPQ